MAVRHLLVAAIVGAAMAGCAMAPSDADVRAKAAAMMKASFKDAGQAKLDRLDQDETQRACSQYAGREIPKDIAARIEQQSLATIQYPADGKLVGDWRAGEKIAQEGRGKQFNDDPSGPVGANCYACHRLAPQEVSYGTIGPSLYRFGKERGFTDDARRYAWGKVFNPDAYAACSNMPRFGHNGILTEQQIRDVVALLMDPASPVNQ
jgi:sulfur-oxidizing protein SoxX